MNIKKIFGEILTVIGIFGLINVAVLFANISNDTHVTNPKTNHSYNIMANQMHYFDKEYFK